MAHRITRGSLSGEGLWQIGIVQCPVRQNTRLFVAAARAYKILHLGTHTSTPNERIRGKPEGSLDKPS